MTDTFRREVRFDPGHVLRRTKGDGSDYGIGSMQIRFLLHGEHGTTQFALFTGWYPEKVPVPGYHSDEWHHGAPSAFDLGAHWDAPWSEYMTEGSGDYAHHTDCDFQPTGECWYDGSGLRARDLEAVFFAKGDAAIWQELEDEYRRIDAQANNLKKAEHA